jgi:hypothetical protein
MTVGTVRTIEACARSCGGKARKSIVLPTGVSMPPPTPWMIRKAIIDSRFQEKAQSAEPKTKTASANMKTFFVPRRSPSQPEAGIQIARLSR